MSNFVMTKYCCIALYIDVGLPQDFNIGWAPWVAEWNSWFWKVPWKSRWCN